MAIKIIRMRMKIKIYKMKKTMMMKILTRIMSKVKKTTILMKR